MNNIIKLEVITIKNNKDQKKKRQNLALIVIMIGIPLFRNLNLSDRGELFLFAILVIACSFQILCLFIKGDLVMALKCLAIVVPLSIGLGVLLFLII